MVTDRRGFLLCGTVGIVTVQPSLNLLVPSDSVLSFFECLDDCSILHHAYRWLASCSAWFTRSFTCEIFVVCNKNVFTALGR